MTYYPTPKLLRWAARRAVRTDLVQEARTAAADNIYTLDRIVDRALTHAREEEALFFEDFGEPMPSHVYVALTAEIGLWEYLHEQLPAFRDWQGETTTEEVDAYTGKVRAYLAVQHDVARMQEEILTSCLVGHYRDLTQHFVAAAAGVGL